MYYDSEHKNGGTQIGDGKNKDLIFTIIDEVDFSMGFYWERFYMELFKSWNIQLKNSYPILNINRKRPHCKG